MAFITQMSVFKPLHHMHHYPLYTEEPTKKLFNYFQVTSEDHRPLEDTACPGYI